MKNFYNYIYYLKFMINNKLIKNKISAYILNRVERKDV